jgi:quercetin dioxygenase-like cupin family protein
MLNTKKIIATFTNMYPGRVIVKNPERNPTEILCEVEPTSKHPDYSVAIAVINKSQPHSHKIVPEIYTVIRGKLTLHVNEESIELNRGESHTVEPGSVHWAEGDETWIECLARPGWTPDDHFIVD